jgi:ubiquinol-cytochrome c reductase subunit 9
MGIFDALYRVVMRRNAVYVTFVVAGAFAGERVRPTPDALPDLHLPDRPSPPLPSTSCFLFESLSPSLDD